MVLYPDSHRHCLWSVTTGVLGSMSSTGSSAHPAVQRLFFLPVRAADPPSSCGPGYHTFPLNTSVKRSLWPLKPETSASAPATNIHYLMTLLSPSANTEPVCLWRAPCADADVSLHCAFSPCSHPSTSGSGSKDQLTKQLSEKSFSAGWLRAADSCFLSSLTVRR